MLPEAPCDQGEVEGSEACGPVVTHEALSDVIPARDTPAACKCGMPRATLDLESAWTRRQPALPWSIPPEPLARLAPNGRWRSIGRCA